MVASKGKDPRSMSTTDRNNPRQPDHSTGGQNPIQFDQADFGQPQQGEAMATMACQVCQTPITSQYYVSGQAVVCPACYQAQMASTTGGSGFARLLRAAVFGIAAGFVGMLIWLTVRKLTSYEVGLIAILVGLMVGGAVRAGSRGRGGIGYQLLAVVITYCSIAANYVPDVYQALREDTLEADSSHVETSSNSGSRAAGGPTSQPTTASASSVGGEYDIENMGMVSRVAMIGLFVVMIFAIAMVAPVLGGVQNLIGLLIIGFALWEAWKMNRATHLQYSGPLDVNPPGGTGQPTGAV